MQHFSVAQANQIQDLIIHSGQQAKRLSNKQFQIFEKGSDDYVTSVDQALDIELAHGFSEFFPADEVISEENAQSRQGFSTANHHRYWLIDPIDGTEDFMHHRPYYAVMVGLLEQHQPQAGWIYAPAFDQFFCGGVDWGLFQGSSDRALAPLSPTEPDWGSDAFPFLLSHKDQRRFGAAIQQQIPKAQFYSLGSFGLKVMEVVLGRAGLYLYLNGRVKLWDTTGPVAIARAAGLVCCDLNGKPLAFDPSAIEPDTLIHRQPILIGWPSYVQRFRPLLQQAVAEILANAS